jgi:serine/threonine protein phosphatase 1
MEPVGLLQMFRRPPPREAKFLDGRVGYAVGDIHGRSDLLAEMLDVLEARAEADSRPAGPPIVVFLGDYVDRGPDSVGVLDLLLSNRPERFERRYLRGNHEQSMMAFMDDPMSNRMWLLHGGAETLMSYGIQPPSPIGAQEQDWIGVAQLLRARLPDAHFSFLQQLERYIELGDYAFVHAGVDAARRLDEQTDEDLYWSRAAFTASKRPFSHRVVHGHTPVDRPYVDQRRIAVDTGAYASGVLTAARFEGEGVHFVTVDARDLVARVRADAAAVDWG